MKIAAGVFKAKCLELMDQVNDHKSEFIITKHGVPVAKLVPVNAEEPPTGLYGAMAGTVLAAKDIIAPIRDKWDAGASS